MAKKKDTLISLRERIADMEEDIAELTAENRRLDQILSDQHEQKRLLVKTISRLAGVGEDDEVSW